jgi:hypothetical protein
MYDPINIYLAQKVMGWKQVGGLRAWDTGEKDQKNQSKIVGFLDWVPTMREDQAFLVLNKFLANCGWKISYLLASTSTLQHCCTLYQKYTILIKITDVRASRAICKAIQETLKNWENR